ncbi:MAG: DUF1223 domain-containing protein [Parvularculaceae bacterium]
MIAAALLLLAADAAPTAVVVELFTSQSCSSCPPAEAALKEIAERDDVVALEWHVDYWNDIAVGADGRWRDPFSSTANTDRQRVYNRSLRNRASVYTPQAVIQGASETVGSRAGEVTRLIEGAERKAAAAISITGSPDGRLSASVSGPEGAKIRLVRFTKSADTRVRGGENAGLHLDEVNVVTSFETLANAGDAPKRLTFDSPAADEGCAILVENEGGPVHAARYCE